MKENNKKNHKGFLALYIVVAVVLALLVFVTVANMTGNATLWGTLMSPAPTISGNQMNCTDSDGGQNFFVKGITKNKKVNFTDYCIIYNQLKEGYCDNGGNVKVNITSCSLYGMVCVDGACKRNQSNQSALTESAGSIFVPVVTSLNNGNQTNCSDTDGGIKPYIFGTVNPGNYPDFCWNNGTNVTNSTVLAEFYCWGNVPQRSLIYCPSGCLMGKCLNVTINDTTPGAEMDDVDRGKLKAYCMSQTALFGHYTTSLQCQISGFNECVSFCYHRSCSANNDPSNCVEYIDQELQLWYDYMCTCDLDEYLYYGQLR